jgi:lipoprotein-anchoring transpeptidase ErfK/SrfK
MDTLRKLAVCYLVAAAAFALAAGLRAWPEVNAAAGRLADVFTVAIWQPAGGVLARAGALLDPPLSDARVVLALQPPGPAEERLLAHVEMAPRPQIHVAEGDVALTLDAPVTITPDLPVTPPAPVAPMPRRAAAPPPRIAAAPPPLPPDTALTPEQARARARLAATLTADMRENFGLFLFVSKAAKGPLAQRLYVFRENRGALDLLYDWAASTGREKREKDAQGDPSFTATPAGLYQFDPGRMYRQYHSANWDQDMPYAMFFNWQRAGLQTGLAIHAASGDDIAKLGMRASAGCVHLSPENARTLFELVKAQYRGQVPRFAIDRNETMSSSGRFSRRADGSLRMADGYRVLIDIENYGGGEDDAVALF